MLPLFAFSITPKIVLHDWLVHHKDTHCQHPDAPTHFDVAGFHCDTDNLVVESPFLGYSPVVVLPLPATYSIQPQSLLPSFISTRILTSGLRGPPAAIA